MNRFGAACAALILVVAALGCSDDSTSVSGLQFSERSDSSFAVGDSSLLYVSNFAGKIVVRQGAPGSVKVVATKRAARANELNQITIEMVAIQNGVQVTADKLSNRDQVLADLEITAPSDTRPNLQIGAGDIEYEGRGEGVGQFSAGTGNVTISLPANANIEVYLAVGAGTVRVDFPVDGQVGNRLVDGTIGTGADGRVDVQVGSGRIIVTRR